MPDIFVPLDTIGFSEYYGDIRNLGLMYRFAFYYTDRNRAELEEYTTASSIESYLDKQDLMPQFIKYASDKGVKPDYEDIRTSNELIHTTIKAYVARNIIDNDGYYPIISAIDNTLNVAIDTISRL